MHPLFIGLSIAALTTAKPTGSHSQRYRSPDGMVVASVVAVRSISTYGENPSVIIIRDRAHHPLAHRNHSYWPNQGLTIVAAVWTKDSRFLVYTTEESGGHQPWRHPIFFYSRRRHRFYSLDDAIGATFTETFTLQAPSTIITHGRYDGPDGRGVRVIGERQPQSSEPLLRVDLRSLEHHLTRAAVSSDAKDRESIAEEKAAERSEERRARHLNS